MRENKECINRWGGKECLRIKKFNIVINSFQIVFIFNTIPITSPAHFVFFRNY